ncbi:MAG: hypothetical protein R8J94_05015 [Acidimicrobiia bacterium]|nr:hypothetical protein [Acidimicrobiia bacterium]
MKILACIPHFFGPSSRFSGGSSYSVGIGDSEVTVRKERRTTYLGRNLASLKALRDLGFDVDTRVCGVTQETSLLPVDWHFPGLEDPTHLVHEVIRRLASEGLDYDYVICIEDDMILPVETFRNVLKFDEISFDNEILHPNRIEFDDHGVAACVDLIASPGWSFHERVIFEHTVGQAHNPHSAIAILARRKLQYATQHIDLDSRARVVGGPMASAFANLHRPFALWRPKSDLTFHTVIHQDTFQAVSGGSPISLPRRIVRRALRSSSRRMAQG